MEDKRARLLCKSGYNQALQGPASVLNRGIVFPYTPTIQTQVQVAYSKYDLVHTNSQPHAFQSSSPPGIQITANFYQQTTEEIEYLAGVYHFLRVVTKMNFGEGDPDRGAPPPVLEFSAYGATNYERVPVLVAGFTQSFPDDVDYVEASIGGGVVQMPTVATIAMDLLVQYSPRRTKSEFTLNGFANGSLYRGGFI